MDPGGGVDALDLEPLARLRVLTGPACRTTRRLCHAASSYQASTPRSAPDFRPGAVFSAFPGATRGPWAPYVAHRRDDAHRPDLVRNAGGTLRTAPGLLRSPGPPLSHLSAWRSPYGETAHARPHPATEEAVIGAGYSKNKNDHEK
ncbi:hypothetical protein STTU_1526 [Streptomyces sp. Tu6071]|nr:hypothetical protein STTU_1526 [Streptomyces sp. Tu6071]